jgi:hypothetical protein
VIARRVSIDRIAKTTLFLTVALAFLCAATRIGDAVSVLAGGAVSWVNLRLIRMLVSRLMAPDAPGRQLSSLVTIKFLFLLAIVAVALRRLPIDAVWFLAGGGSLFVAIVLDAVLLGEPAPIGGNESGSA